MKWIPALALLALSCRADLTLFDFDRGPLLDKVEQRSVKASYVAVDGGQALRVDTIAEGKQPGLTLRPPRGKWNAWLFTTIEMEVTNLGASPLRIALRVDNPGANGAKNCVTGYLRLEPGESGTLARELTRTAPAPAPVKLFGMRGYPPKQAGEKQAIDVRNITALQIFVPEPKEEHAFRVDSIRLTGTYDGPSFQLMQRQTGSFLPFIDTFGQYIHKDWPGKTHSLEELHARRDAEAAELAKSPGPDSWDQYGGWKDGPQLEATGFFYTAKYAGKWWLVDPEGRLFFSHGVDCVAARDPTPLDGRDGWFRDLPDGPVFTQFYGRQRHVAMGYYKGKEPRCFSFSPANVLRKYEGGDWYDRFADTTHLRLRAWGLNTIANWSDPRIYLKRKTPYVVAVYSRGKVVAGSTGHWGQFRDVLDPDFKEKLQAVMKRQATTSANDPWCIGYFVDNEVSWGGEVSLAAAVLASPKGQFAKQVLVSDLQAKYGTIANLNQAWGTEYASWQALLDHQRRKGPGTKEANTDLVAFNRKMVETYFRTIRDAIREVAPHQLYLGCRFAWVNNMVANAAAKYCDVVSYNIYGHTVSRFRCSITTDVPLIVGEFHFGALDRGMFHGGLCRVGNQAERAVKYEQYVRSVLRHPQFVGCHWFKYVDEPTTGRALDGENYQIGLVDIVDTPYPETIEAVRKVANDMYTYRLNAK
jgi:hypothetical protein